jgi:hypothetical protein
MVTPYKNVRAGSKDDFHEIIEITINLFEFKIEGNYPLTELKNLFE